MNCKVCGKKLAGGATQCARCGTAVDAEIASAKDQLPTSTLQLPDMSSPTASPVVADPNATFQAPPSNLAPAAPETRDTARLGSDGAADDSTTDSSPDQTIAGDSNRPSAPAADTGRRQMTVMNRDSEAIKQVWKNLADSEASPLKTFKADSRNVQLETMVIQRRTLKPQDEAGSDHADYQLLRFLGEGGMGTVYEANQSAVQRRVAVKTLKPEYSRRQSDRHKFLNEAKITGDLDHPNIVPIHDLGISDDGTVFYSMKLVGGQPWESEMRERSRMENIDILLKVCDAIAFAHSRHVIHRDLKPENIMLGEFGEVLVMDWGLAVNLEKTAEFVLGGTPAYMAPEMAIHDVDRIGFCSDVYLLSAMLYEVVSGYPPHPGATVTECVAAASKNVILPVESDDELLQIALHGMATSPADRFQSVAQFRAAVVQYQSHQESIKATDRGYEELEHADTQSGYESFSRAVFSFQDALELWPDNSRAQVGLQEAKMAYATRALKQEDFDLGLSLVSPAFADEAPLHRELTTRSKERASRQKRLQIARWIATGSGVVALLAIAAFLILRRDTVALVLDQPRLKREVATLTEAAEEAEAKIAEANTKTVEAELATIKAQEVAADATEKAAAAAEQLAQTSSQIEALQSEQMELQASNADLLKQGEEIKTRNLELSGEVVVLNESLVDANNRLRQNIVAARLGQYQSDILLARAQIDSGRVGLALDRLNQTLNNDQIPPDIKDWEFHRLYQMCHQSGWSWQPEPAASIEHITANAEGSHLAAITDDGRIYWITPDADELQVTMLDQIRLTGVVADIALSADGQHLAIALRQSAPLKNLQVWNLDSQRLVAEETAHQVDVRFVAFLNDATLISGGNNEFIGQYTRWHLSSDRLNAEVAVNGYQPMQVARLSPSKKYLIVGCANRRLHRYPVNDWSAATRPDEYGDILHKSGISADFGDVEFDPSDPDEGTIICGMTSGEVYRVFADGTSAPQLLHTHSEPVTVLAALSDNPAIVASASADETIELHRTDGNIDDNETITGHRGKVISLTALGDGQRMVAGDATGTMRVWTMGQNQDERIVRLDNDFDLFAAATTAVRPDGSYAIVAADAAGQIELRHSGTLAVEDTWLPPGHAREAGRFNAYVDEAAATIVSGADDGVLICHDVATGRVRCQYAMHTSAVFALSPDGQRVLFIDPDNPQTLIVANPMHEQILGQVTLARQPNQIVISADSRGAAVVGDDGHAKQLQLMDLMGIKLVGNEFYYDNIRSITPSVDNMFLICDTKRSGLTGTEYGAQKIGLDGERNSSRRIGFSAQIADSQRLGNQTQFLTYVTDVRAQESQFHIWDETIWSDDSSAQTEMVVRDVVEHAQFVPGSDRIIYMTNTGDVKFWNPADAAAVADNFILPSVIADLQQWRIPFDSRPSTNLTGNQLNRTLLRRIEKVGDRSLVVGQGYCHLLNAAGVVEHRIAPVPVATRVDLLDANRLLARFSDGRVWLLGLTDQAGKLKIDRNNALQIHNYFLDATASNDGQTVVLIGVDQKLYQFDPGSGRLEQFDLDANPDETYTAVRMFESDSGKTLAAATRDGEIVVNSWPSKERVALLTPPPDVPTSWWKMRFSPDGRLLVAISARGAATAWATTDWSRADFSQPPRDIPVVSVQFNPLGNRLVVGREDSTISVMLVGISDGGFADQSEKLGSGIPTVISLFAAESKLRRPVYIAMFSPDGRELISSTLADNRLVRWLTTGWDLPKPFTPEEPVVDPEGEITTPTTTNASAQ